MCATRCPICGTAGDPTQVHPANFPVAALDPAVFSARRLPDRLHFRLVRCDRCGLLRSDPIADPALLARLYARSSFDYGDETASIRRTYGRYLARLHPRRHDALLEIGCGNGFFLEEAVAQGYREAWGVEPSRDAVARASPQVRARIILEVMRPGLFDSERFDAVCAFQVLEHVPDPAGLLTECLRLLRPGGKLLLLNHDSGALTARVLGERSPIIDLEHLFLYSRATLARLATQCGFLVERSGQVRNDYSLHYLVRLLPLPTAVKARLLSALRHSRWGRLCLRVPLGNQYLICSKGPSTSG
jgi:SAM-dependent methyltransferase